jgi:hypothetical protein
MFNNQILSREPKNRKRLIATITGRTMITIYLHIEDNGEYEVYNSYECRNDVEERRKQYRERMVK